MATAGEGCNKNSLQAKERKIKEGGGREGKTIRDGLFAVLYCVCIRLRVLCQTTHLKSDKNPRKRASSLQLPLAPLKISLQLVMLLIFTVTSEDMVSQRIA